MDSSNFRMASMAQALRHGLVGVVCCNGVRRGSEELHYQCSSLGFMLFKVYTFKLPPYPKACKCFRVRLLSRSCEKKSNPPSKTTLHHDMHVSTSRSPRTQTLPSQDRVQYFRFRVEGLQVRVWRFGSHLFAFALATATIGRTIEEGGVVHRGVCVARFKVSLFFNKTKQISSRVEKRWTSPYINDPQVEVPLSLKSSL